MHHIISYGREFSYSYAESTLVVQLDRIIMHNITIYNSIFLDPLFFKRTVIAPKQRLFQFTHDGTPYVPVTHQRQLFCQHGSDHHLTSKRKFRERQEVGLTPQQIDEISIHLLLFCHTLRNITFINVRKDYLAIDCHSIFQQWLVIYIYIILWGYVLLNSGAECEEADAETS